MRWSIGPIGIKDLFTLVNLLGGVAGIYFVIDGRLELAGLAVMAGYLFGDTLDGIVARATGTSNQFGGAFDSVTDHLTQAIAPGIIVFAVYRQGGHAALGFTLMAIIMAAGSVRHALFSVAKLDNPLTYCGLPRTVSGYAAMGLVLSHLFRASPLWFPAGAVIIAALALAGLVPIPYMTHRGVRRMQLYVKFLVVGFLVTPAVALIFARDFVFDVLSLWMFGYALFAWFPLRPDERKAFFARYRQWTSEVSR